MKKPLRPCLVACLAGPCIALAAPAPGADPPDVPTAPARRAPPSPQRLDWRITELEGELAALQRFAQQQDARLGELRSQVEARARRTRTDLTLAAGWALVLALFAWQAVRRRRP